MGLGSEIRDRKKSIPDPGFRGKKATGSGSATLKNTLSVDSNLFGPVKENFIFSTL
jgi:hypothetical protein